MSWEPINPEKPKETELIGDGPFDIMADALVQISKCYKDELRRKPTTLELVTTFERVLAPHFSEIAAEGEVAELVEVKAKTKKIPKRQKCAAGVFVRAVPANGKSVYGRLFDSRAKPPFCGGPELGVYDSLGFEGTAWFDLSRRRLVVKIFPIHHELLEERAWLVVGHLPLDEFDRQQPRGPYEVSGHNDQLIAANYYYGLSDKRFYNIEKCLNR